MTKLKWETPPISNGRGTPSPLREIIAELTKRPNEWAVVFEGEAKIAYDSSSTLKRIAGSMQVDVEAMVRTVDRVSRVYARVVPK